MDPSSSLHALCPLDGRYRGKVEDVASYFSEFSYIKHRVEVEVEYFIHLLKIEPKLPQFEKVPTTIDVIEGLKRIYIDFTDEDAMWIKQTETTGGAPGGPELGTNHDVKSVEYFVKYKMEKLSELLGVKELNHVKEFIHFGLTSQDINNTSYPLLLFRFYQREYIPQLMQVVVHIDRLARQWADKPLLARTHGQPASPTMMGKEMMVFVERLKSQIVAMCKVPHNSKFGGATGNFNAHSVAFPEVDWIQFANNFIKDVGLERLEVTTQIEHYDNMAALMDGAKRINTILLDFCRDVWAYVSMGVFKQRPKKGEIGSSAMPHKVNPIDFENAEGNLGVANALFEHLSAKLPISRLQRDLTDSTVTRNVGVPYGHTIVAIKSIMKGLSKVYFDEVAVRQELNNHWEVVAEAIQTILRREQIDGAYELLKEETRGVQVTPERISAFVDKLGAKYLNLSQDTLTAIHQVTPENYTGVFKMPEPLLDYTKRELPERYLSDVVTKVEFEEL